MADTSPARPTTRLVASTGKDYCYNILEPYLPVDKERTPDSETDSASSADDSSKVSLASHSSTASVQTKSSNAGIFRNLLWSADGTSLITTSADNAVRSFILPPSLLDQSSNHHLVPYSTQEHPSPIYATAISPYYSLASPETALVLTSPASLPIRLFSPFAHGILARYPHVDLSTEKWITPHSLLFTSPSSGTDGSLRFLAGSRNQISLFDVSQDGGRPMTFLPTAPGNRKSRRGGGNGMAGIVSAMAMSPDGVLAAGTFSRGVGLYDAYGMGDTIGTWILKHGEHGDGVTSMHWSRCGRYLVIAERDSDGLQVWDIRGTGQKLAWLKGRKATTMQRLGAALGGRWCDFQHGEDVYAGGTDGIVRVWEDVGMREGQIDFDWEWQAHEDVVSDIQVHPCGSVVATCSGSRHGLTNGDSDNDSDSAINVDHPDKGESRQIDSSLRVWSLEALSLENERLPPCIRSLYSDLLNICIVLLIHEFIASKYEFITT